MHSLHKSQYYSTFESYFAGGTLAGQNFCGKVELNDKIKPSPLHTKGLTEKKAKFICRYCRKSFVRQAYYEEHELKHRVVTHHRCNCCGLYFPNAHKCQRHKHKATCTPLILDPSLQTADHSESSHEKSEMADLVETVGSNVELRNCFVKLMDVCKTSRSPERIHCKVCGKTFRLRAQLNAHLRSHSDEKPFKCDNCGKAFKYTWNLNKHKREHKFPPKFKSFASPDSLKKHLQLHKGNKPFRCLDCGKNFARHGHLMAHKNVHRRNVQCSVCWEVLPSIGDLLKHRQSHPKKGMLKCPDCPLQFKFPVFLLRHVAVHERRRKLKELLPPKDQATPQKVQEIHKEEFKCGLCQEGKQNKTET
uniref:C2H2-type domain-containing protein n=1 Tax=Cyprinus carpio TaxID=7962 RepID=A0A8C2PZ98_CYPCA